METVRNIVRDYLLQQLFNTVSGTNGRYAQYQGATEEDKRDIALYNELGNPAGYVFVDEALDYIGLGEVK